MSFFQEARPGNPHGTHAWQKPRSIARSTSRRPHGSLRGHADDGSHMSGVDDPEKGQAEKAAAALRMVAKRVRLASRSSCRTAHLDPGSTRPGSKRRQDNARQFGKQLDSSSGIALWRDDRHTVVELLYLLGRLRILEGVTRIEGRRGDSDGGLGLKGNLGWLQADDPPGPEAREQPAE